MPVRHVFIHHLLLYCIYVATAVFDRDGDVYDSLYPQNAFGPLQKTNKQRVVTWYEKCSDTPKPTKQDF